MHTADIHLDSPLRGLASDGPVDQIRGAVREALASLAGLAEREQVNFVLIAGDIYDGTWDTADTGMYFLKWLDRLQKSGIEVYAISGNHDAQSKMTNVFKLPANPSGRPVMLSSSQPETVVLDDIDVAIHGRGFSQQAEAENLVRQYPAAIAGKFNIGMLHTSLDGVGGAHHRYAPCSNSDLISLGYDYWALGHIHTRKHHHKPGEAPIVFPGNIQGRHVRESGPKGCEVVSVDHSGNVSMQFVRLDVFRWEICDVNVDGVESPDELLSRFAIQMQNVVAGGDGLPMAVRVIVSGISTAHDAWLSEPEKWSGQIRADAISVGGADVWIEKVKFNTRPLKQLTAEDVASGPIEEVLRLFDELAIDDEMATELDAALDDMRGKLPAELNRGTDAIAPKNDVAALRSLLSEIQPMLVHRLTTEAVGS
ncbi:metallophosphoesterase family protein [Rubripirellula reticaptiva]|uniref:metallophosphoesterase family protein n=1 Tax=Rubripirellula reticaptiva TaxID=2528013 RepID=UPI0021BCF9E2|nr:DNA repair exonuclease [Rubripirellula reticaptiva]